MRIFSCKTECEYKVRSWFSPSINAQNAHECFTGQFHGTYLPHALFTFFLLFKQLLFTRDVAAVAFCKNIFAKSTHGLSGNDFAADRSLNRNFKLLPGNDFLKLFGDGTPFCVRLVTVNNG